MKHRVSTFVLAGLIFLVGCGTDYYADKMVMPNTNNGKFDLAMGSSGDDLVAKGKISDHRQGLLADGAQIDYWLINASADITTETEGTAMATILLIHDLGESKASLLKLGQRLSGLGYDVVLPDLRTHGRSSGDFFTYGAKEKKDIQTLMNELLRSKTVSPKIIAFGEGVGGSIAIVYAAEDPNCMGVIAFQPYADLRGSLESQSTFSMLKEETLDEVIDAGCANGDFEPAKASPALAAMQLRCPIRLIRRKGDMGYDADQTQRIYDSTSGHKELEIIGMGSEDWSFVTDSTDYLAAQINEFALGGLVTGYYRDVMKHRRDTTIAP